MDLATILGFILGLGALLVGFTLEGGHIGALVQPSAALIVFGGTIGATMFSFSPGDFKALPQLIKLAMFNKPYDPTRTIEEIVAMAEEARREGLLYLENRLPEINDPYLRKGLQLVIDGTDPELVKKILEVEIYAIEERHGVGSSIFEVAGGYAPTMGIIGTVMGLVHVLGNMSDPDSLGPAIAVAFMATLYGVGSANVLWLPLAAKLSNISKKEILLKELMMEGIISLQAGYNPILIRERLVAYLKPSARNKKGDEDEAAEEE
ncbi:flagellar motor protein [Desulfallas thermosapovorans]|uniref:Chemotaxis protein MotA n=1 Tax=Desulfallas thermosapovorans DSM 6562 TaxID=1121431 RepID=A0A5S4ZRR6_9FIRM|nr:flagellar motor protein [Desulfallas thermosapovorans]TYO95536.1 chemotaxis protein MotA [Desulfallas thermosapovorans DSM 6562]